ncbi:MAG: hypothetical protein R3E66_23355 [bacterium]
MNDTSLEARFYAMLLLTQLSAEGLLEDVFPRLFDRDQQIRNIARSVAMAYQSAPNFRSALLDPLRNRLRVTNEELHIDVCTDLLTRLRDVPSIPLLMEQLGKHREHTNKNIHSSLQLLTFHNWSSPYEWKQWWATAKDQARYLWLVAAMDSQSDQLRALAFDELQRLPGLETNYQPEQPSKLRQREQKVVEEWFQKNL